MGMSPSFVGIGMGRHMLVAQIRVAQQLGPFV